jgi:hypothetical protein
MTAIIVGVCAQNTRSEYRERPLWEKINAPREKSNGKPCYVLSDFFAWRPRERT